MAHPRKQRLFDLTAGVVGDQLRVAFGAELIVIAMDGKARTADRRQRVGQRPCGEIRRQPGIDPCTQDPVTALTVIAAQTLALRGVGEPGPGLADA